MASRLAIALGAALLLGGAACAKKALEPPPLVVDPLLCPVGRESSAGKIAHETYLRAHSDLTQSVIVRLRRLPADKVLSERQALNARQVSCVLEAFGPPGAVGGVRAEWYEAPMVQAGGVPIPIGTAFSALALWEQLEAVARHPYVERIEPGLGEAAKLGVNPPEIPAECPEAGDAAGPKLVDAAGIQGQGRQPAIIDLRRELVPELRPCPGGDTCDDLVASGWERTIVARRMETCVRTWIDSKVRGPALEVPYTMADGIPNGPRLPPFSDSIHATLAFGLGLTWDELTEIAKHPYVARVWTSPGLTIGTSPDGCPPDYDAPIPAPTCTTAMESIDGKFSAASREGLEASQGPNEVILSVRREGNLCPQPQCPGRPIDCPEWQRYNDWNQERARVSQTCVLALIAQVGGTAGDTFVLGNALLATLTWPQLQIVAASPDVVSVGSRFEHPPPP